ncbi:unnamed protein product [Caenorhabditis angaria]|uniref:Tetraspanin n=1 Tax=Caenorhabditis angaria TaxID=860376 RepID=A0A9P1N9F4_9PELO|nr:unnamed protein product [Caenorhabditis angaria]
MVAGCGNKCVKYIFWVINFLFFILGLLLVGVAVWLIFDKSMLFSLLSSTSFNTSSIDIDQLNYMLYVAIGIGAPLIILGFFGCCGSCCESLCAIGLYFFLVLVLFVVEIVAIILYFSQKTFLQEKFTTIWRDELVSKYTTQTQVKTFLDQVQTSLSCCGASGCTDYVQYGSFPTSCSCATIQQSGCATVIWNLISNNLIYVGFVFIIILFVELFAMILSCIIIGAVRETRRGE